MPSASVRAFVYVLKQALTRRRGNQKKKTAGGHEDRRDEQLCGSKVRSNAGSKRGSKVLKLQAGMKLVATQR